MTVFQLATLIVRLYCAGLAIAGAVILLGLAFGLLPERRQNRS